LFAPDEGTVVLFYKVGREIPDWQTRVLRSGDGGLSWSRPAELVPGDRGGRGPVKNKVLVLADGTWLAPASTERGVWDAFVDISTDGGRSWRRSETVPLDHESFRGPGVIQPTLWESAPGRVHMLLRSSCGYICRSDSEDGGRTWSFACETTLPNNNSGIDLVKLPTGRLALAYNPVGADRGPRTPLVVGVSDDNGDSWQTVAILEDEAASPGTGRAEFSYPAVVAGKSGVEVTYTWKRRGIVHAQVTGLL
jgi:predicted neuraminidase